MDGSYCDDMKAQAESADLERGLVFSLHSEMATGTLDERRNCLRRLKWHALTLWHEAGKPLPFVAHLGPFVRIGAL